MPELLVIEDEPKLLRILQRGLQEEGYTVVAADNGADGYRFASSKTLDAVILDLMLPDRDGLSVLRELRREGFSRPILVVTARDSVPDRVAGLDGGADDYLVKPFAFSELLARLRALLRRDAIPGGEVTRLAAGNLEIDLLRRRVTRGGEEITLTNREFELLEYLARRLNEPVSRESIVREVWQDTTGILTKVVDVSINHLRRKIERRRWPKLLHTVRGVGYCLGDAPCRD
ncbi:MAG: DNA-binding response regulator [Planctomycetota bacterium]|nr:MAG: DNA-binding response regulator [Planctomycetota bacterium]REJ94757.1 MAG: DNA-binding response regulator [Planctomycetota bacterium]REK29213.1 MAG: DNA-binding response regulator [Planctomycetota bacterium]REK29397.1 MAG: DNA-binding response regulator [Planctomycetota bacterium]